MSLKPGLLLHTSAGVRVCLSRLAVVVTDKLQNVLDGRELRRGGGGGLTGEEVHGRHLLNHRRTRHGFCPLLRSFLADLSGEAGDDVGRRSRGSSHENLLTGGTAVSSLIIIIYHVLLTLGYF